MSILNRFVDDTVCRIDMLYDHLTIAFSSGNGICINNIFSTNFDGLVKILNKKVIEIINSSSEIKFVFDAQLILTIDMTDAGYTCPEALSIYFKDTNETIVW